MKPITIQKGNGFDFIGNELKLQKRITDLESELNEAKLRLEMKDKETNILLNMKKNETEILTEMKEKGRPKSIIKDVSVSFEWKKFQIRHNLRIDSWNILVRETRKLLGLTKNEFITLLGITMPTLDNWQYNGVVPYFTMQEVITKLYLNHKKAAKKLREDKKKYLNYFCGLGEKDSYWKEAIQGKNSVGAVTLVAEIITK